MNKARFFNGYSIGFSKILEHMESKNENGIINELVFAQAKEAMVLKQLDFLKKQKEDILNEVSEFLTQASAKIDSLDSTECALKAQLQVLTNSKEGNTKDEKAAG